MPVWIPDRGELQMGFFVLLRKLRLSLPSPEATGLLYCPIRLSQVLENPILPMQFFPQISKIQSLWIQAHQLSLFFRSFFYLCKWRDWLWGQGKIQVVKKRPWQVRNSQTSVRAQIMKIRYRFQSFSICLYSNRDVQKDPGRPRVPVVCLERLKILVSQLPPHGRRQSDPLPASGAEMSETQQRTWHDATPEVCLIPLNSVEKKWLYMTYYYLLSLSNTPLNIFLQQERHYRIELLK